MIRPLSIVQASIHCGRWSRAHTHIHIHTHMNQKEHYTEDKFVCPYINTHKNIQSCVYNVQMM